MEKPGRTDTHTHAQPTHARSSSSTTGQQQQQQQEITIPDVAPGPQGTGVSRTVNLFLSSLDPHPSPLAHKVAFWHCRERLCSGWSHHPPIIMVRTFFPPSYPPDTHSHTHTPPHPPLTHTHPLPSLVYLHLHAWHGKGEGPSVDQQKKWERGSRVRLKKTKITKKKERGNPH